MIQNKDIKPQYKTTAAYICAVFVGEITEQEFLSEYPPSNYLQSMTIPLQITVDKKYFPCITPAIYDKIQESGRKIVGYKEWWATKTLTELGD